MDLIIKTDAKDFDSLSSRILEAKDWFSKTHLWVIRG